MTVHCLAHNMPELPEVEAARRALHDNCSGRVILSASIADDPKVIDGVSPAALQKALIGRKILGACRKGKNLWLQLDERPWPSFQFGMTGAFHMKGKEITKYKRSAVSDKEEWPSKFSKVFFKLDDALEVSFTDKRRFARVRLLDDPLTAPPVSELGPDAYLELPLESNFVSSISKKKCPIKALLLDQNFIAGIGNWIADEVLYQANIHPEQIANSMSEKECIALHRCIQEVIKFSVEVDADSDRFPQSWIFHHRWMKKPGQIGGNKIDFITVGGRTSAYVPALQKCTFCHLEKPHGMPEKQLGKELLENSKSLTKKRGARGTQKNNEEEIQLSVKAKEGSIKGGRKKKTSQIETNATEQKEARGVELKTLRKQKRVQSVEITAEKTQQKKASTKQKTGRLSKARKQEIDNKEQAALAEQTKQGMSPAGKQAEQEDCALTEAVMDVTKTVQNQPGESNIRNKETAECEHNDESGIKAQRRKRSGRFRSVESEHNDEVGKQSQTRKGAGNVKKGMSTDLPKSASMSHVSADTLKRPQGQKRKHGSKAL